ncbi:GrlR family regulatory protein [Achromobacter insuavis]|uniref:GrlR family regulatory protein n=1 Tax=Achromobacter insuavis TaxID=1287735 RepID=UPI0009C08987|nr:GrlR family regulatory protein [Achromobacter insuavis]
MLRDGFYKVDFAASLPSAGGVVVLEGGVIRGGDDQMIYSGSYGLVGSDPSAPMRMTGEISVRPYVKGANSVFNSGSQPFTLKLNGSADTSSFRLGGNSPVGGPSIVIVGAFIAPLDF